MKNLITPAIICLFSSTITVAQVTSETFDPVWAAQFQAAIDNAVSSGSIRGVSVALSFPGQGTFIGVGGESTPGVLITPDMQFGVGSNSKLFTAVLVMKLQELGLLSLDDQISDWLPDYDFIDPAITIRQLLSHQSGVFDFETEIDPQENFYQNMDTFVYGPDFFYYPEDVLAMIGPAHFTAGEKYAYSNTNYLLAAMIIEAASGKSFVENMHEYILDPLDLDSTFVAAYEDPNGNVAHGWHLGDDIGNVPTTAPHSMYLGSGSVFSTANEMVQWVDNLMAGNVISQESLDEISKLEPSSVYGLGLSWAFWPTYPDDEVLQHGGWVPGYTSQMGFDVRRNSTLVVLANDENDFSVLIPILIEFYDNYPRRQDDASILSVQAPSSELCATTVYPEVILKNYGLNALTSAVINYQVDGGTVNTFEWGGNLTTDQTAIVALPGITVSAGNHTFRSYTSDPNGALDGYPHNDHSDSQFSVNTGDAITSVDEDFESSVFPPPGWLSGDNRTMDWGRSSLSLLDGTGCIVKNNVIDFTGRTYDLELPLIDLNEADQPVLSFDYAYGYATGFFDELSVLISDDCGQTYHTIFHKIGPALKTANAEEDFYPNDDQWKNKTLYLMGYHSDEVLIKFRAKNDNGNNLYIDNIKVVSSSQQMGAPEGSNAHINDQEHALVIHEPTDSESNALTLYPNPANASTTVEFAADGSARGKLRVIDLTGRIVHEQAVVSDGSLLSIEINTESYPRGIYKISLIMSDAEISKMLIRQ